MCLIYTNNSTGEVIKSDKHPSCEQLLSLLQQMKTPGSTLITTLPSGMGLDFDLQADGRFWVEFYADDISSAFVTLPIAKKLVERAFEGGKLKIKEQYADLINQWEY